MEPITVGLAMESESCRLRKENKELQNKLKKQEQLVESLTAQLLEHEKRMQPLKKLASWVHQVVFKHGTRPPRQANTAEGPYLGQLFLKGTRAEMRYKELKRAGKWREPGSGSPVVIREIHATLRGMGKLEWVDMLYQMVIGQVRRLGPIALAEIRRNERKSGSYTLSDIERYVISDGPMVGQYGMRAKRALKAPRILGPYPGALLTDPEFQQLVPVMDQPKHLLYHMSAGDSVGGFFIDPLEARTNHCTINDLVLINDCRTDPLGPPLGNPHLERLRLEEEAGRQNVATVHVTLDNDWVVVLSVLIKDVEAGGVLWTDYGEGFFTSASPKDAEVYGQLKQCAQALNGQPVPIPLDSSYHLTPLVDLENSQKSVPLSPPTTPSSPDITNANSTSKNERKRGAADTDVIWVDPNPEDGPENAKTNGKTEKATKSTHQQQSKKTKPDLESRDSQSPPALASANESNPSEMEPDIPDFVSVRGPMWRRFETDPLPDYESGQNEASEQGVEESVDSVDSVDVEVIQDAEETVSEIPVHETENPEIEIPDENAVPKPAKRKRGRPPKEPSGPSQEDMPMGPPPDLEYWQHPPEMFPNPDMIMPPPPNMMPPPNMLFPNAGMVNPNFQFPYPGFPQWTPGIMLMDPTQTADGAEWGTNGDGRVKKGGSKKKLPKNGNRKSKSSSSESEEDGSLSDNMPIQHTLNKKMTKSKPKTPVSAPLSATATSKKKTSRKGSVQSGGGVMLYENGHETLGYRVIDARCDAIYEADGAKADIS